MTGKFLIVALLVTALAPAYGQEEYAFKVLVNKGQNSLRSGNDWEPLKVGLKLRAVDEVKLSPNAYLGLMHVSGKPLELKGAGTHKVANLTNRIDLGETSVMNKYAEFLLSSNEGRKNRMAATGAVTRGLHNIKLMLPPLSTYVFSDSLAVAWMADKKINGPYVVTLTSLFGDVLKTMETDDTVVMLNLNDEALRHQNDVKIAVHPRSHEDRRSDAVALRKFSPDDRERHLTQYREIAPAVAEPTAFNQWILAKFFEDRKLIADAASALLQAVQMAPDVAEYREDYEAFLLRNGLKPPPQK